METSQSPQPAPTPEALSLADQILRRLSYEYGLRCSSEMERALAEKDSALLIDAAFSSEKANCDTLMKSNEALSELAAKDAKEINKLKEQIAAFAAREGEVGKFREELRLAGESSEYWRKSAEHERDQRQKFVGQQEYQGNTVSYIYDKAKCYGDMVHGCVPALAAAGFPVDENSDSRKEAIAKAVRQLAEALTAERVAHDKTKAELEAVKRAHHKLVREYESALRSPPSPVPVATGERAALLFYADLKNWNKNDQGESAVGLDHGKIADHALFVAPAPQDRPMTSAGELVKELPLLRSVLLRLEHLGSEETGPCEVTERFRELLSRHEKEGRK